MLKDKTNKRSINISLGVILVVIGILLVSSDYLKEKKNRAFEIINFELYNLEEKNDEGDYKNDELSDILKEEEKVEPPKEEKPEETPLPAPNPTPQPEQNQPAYYYIGLLEIPKIGLKKGFVSPDSSHNNVDENITIIKKSTLPNVDKGNFILAAHSGTGYISYFKNLYQLVVGDYAYIYYENIKYVYKIVDIYTQPKNGKISIYRDYNETILTLITCTKNDETKQTVYIANLVEKTGY